MRRVGLGCEQVVEGALADDEGLHVLGRDGRGGAWAAVEERDLAEEVPADGGLQQDPLTSIVAEEDLDRARLDDEHPVAGIAGVEDGRARGELLGAHVREQFGLLARVEERKERHVGQDVLLHQPTWALTRTARLEPSSARESGAAGWHES